MSSALLEITGLSFSYPGGSEVLRSIDLSVDASEILVLTGPSGCGKSTLLRLIAGLEIPAAGNIALAGAVLSSAQVFVPAEHRPVGYVFQGHALFPHLTVRRNISFGLRHLDKSERKKVVQEHMDLLGLDGLGDRYPHQISGGQQQRVAIARSLARKPELLLMDEPFSDLDGATRSTVRSEVKQILKRLGITAVIVSHDAQDAAHIADRIVEMSSGSRLRSGAAALLP